MKPCLQSRRIPHLARFEPGMLAQRVKAKSTEPPLLFYRIKKKNSATVAQHTYQTAKESVISNYLKPDRDFSLTYGNKLRAKDA